MHPAQTTTRPSSNRRQVHSWVLLAMVPFALAVPATASDLFDGIYAEFAEQAGGFYDPPPELGLGPAPRSILARALRTGETTRQVGVGALVDELALPPPAAEVLFEATLHAWKSRNVPWMSEERVHHLHAAEAAYEHAYALAPDHPETLLALAAFYDQRAGLFPEALDRLLGLTSGRPADDPLWRALEYRTGFSSRLRVAHQALDLDPRSPAWLEFLAQSKFFTYRPLAQAAAYAALRELFSDGDPPDISLAVRARWLAEEVDALLDSGLWQLALDRLAAAPREVRDAMLDAPVGRAEPLPPSHVRRDLDVRLRLAMALLLADRPEDADAMLARIPPSEFWLPEAGGMGTSLETFYRKLLALVGAEDEDPYEMLTQVVGAGTHQPAQGGIFLAVAAKVAEEAGYRAFAKFLTHRTRHSWRSNLDQQARAILPPRVLTQLVALEQAQAHAIEELGNRVAQLEDATAMVADFQRQTEPVDWSTLLPEWALPKDEQPIDLTGPRGEVEPTFDYPMLSIAGTAPAYSRRGLGRGALPRGFQPVTQGEIGDRRGSVVLGHAMGHRFGHGYWWVESEDGGETWTEPVFTGLLIRRPYQLLPDTWLRPLDDGRWRLAVELWNRREDGSWLPTSTGELSIDPAALRVDSDDDGLTDLLEERLGLDPENTDSDADGLDDGVDPVPRAAYTGSGNSAAEAMALALEAALVHARTHDRGTFPGRSPVVLASGLLDSELLKAFAPNDPVHFLDPRRYGSFPNRELDRWVPLVLELFEIDHDGRRALLLTRRAGDSARILLERGELGWKVETTGGGISCGALWGDP